ncbi:C-type mannose receptor 2-like [Saccostrea echinata]|uniref:C-type mannose receptor 2-like n=1 Tax=Saccostrea echinata TaxID=191078 RepID=UPI002A821FBF|nr:C-type mannose receptor 2-like [Saccostrea echinata]
MKTWSVVVCWLCATALVGSSDKQAYICTPPFQIYEGNCYHISKDKVSGDEAFARCSRMGAYLANFETLEEAMLMKKKLKEMNSGLHFYVGGRNINRRKPGGDWRWIRNGEMKEMTYFAFGAGQPNGSDKAPQECMFFYAAERYIFHDVFCDHDTYLGGYICEKSYICSPPFQIYEGNCYYISKDKVSGDEAFARCSRMGAYLANFETLEEAMLMKKKLNEMNSGLHFYVGGRNINRRKPGGDWRWIKNGEMKEMTYFAFGSSQPDGADTAPQDCMFFYAAERYIFHDVFCDHDAYLGGYICEK